MKLYFWDREPEEHETSIFSLFTAVSDVGKNIRNVWHPPASMASRKIWICSSSELPELLPTCHSVEEFWLSFCEYETVKWSETNVIMQFVFVLICKGNYFKWKDIFGYEPWKLLDATLFLSNTVILMFGDCVAVMAER